MFILGLPINEYTHDESPPVVWEGSHNIVQQTFHNLLSEHPSDSWCDIDVTKTYQSMRKTIFKTCKRREILAKPGEAYVIHRLSLHGVAPWKASASSKSNNRMICYFRPEMTNKDQWLQPDELMKHPDSHSKIC